MCKGSCLDGFYLMGSECLQCNVLCKMCNEIVDKCFICVLGFFKKNDFCVKDCGFGYYLDSFCKKCSINCVDC